MFKNSIKIGKNTKLAVKPHLSVDMQPFPPKMNPTIDLSVAPHEDLEKRILR